MMIFVCKQKTFFHFENNYYQFYDHSFITFFIFVDQFCQCIHQSSNYRTTVLFFLDYFDVNVQYSLAVNTINLFQYMSKEKKTFLFNVKTKNCPISCREAQKDVGIIDLRVTYNANVITVVRMTNVRLLHDHRKTQVQFLWASHVAIGNPSPNKIVYDTYD